MMIEVPSYVRNHVEDLERALVKIREKAEALRSRPPTPENLEALRTNEAIAESIERTLNAAKADPFLS